MLHHTKTKGDIGLGKVMSDLMSQEFSIAVLLSEHLPYDCIAISESGTLYRVSVKYVSQVRNGIINVRVSKGKNSTNRQFENNHCDVVAVFCQETGLCYYIDSNEFGVARIYLRVNDAKRADPRIRLANDYTNAKTVMK